jgi:hypothetical protein
LKCKFTTQAEIELFSVDGNVAVIGDLNGRVGKEPDFLRHDNLNRQLNDNMDSPNRPLQILKREDLHSWSIRFPKILGGFKSSVNLSQNISSGTYSIKLLIV